MAFFNLFLVSIVPPILVLTSSYNSYNGTMFRFEKNDSIKSEWKLLDNPIDVVVGRKGLAWGRGLHKVSPQNKPNKKEGDKCSPAGIFNLTYAVGFAHLDSLIDVKLPYFQITESIYCIDDVNSKYYNEIVDIDTMKTKDWTSSVKLSKIPRSVWSPR